MRSLRPCRPPTPLHTPGDTGKQFLLLLPGCHRNLVAVPAPPPPSAGGSSGAADAHRRIKRGLLDRLFADNVMDLLLLLAQHARSQPFRWAG